MADALSVSQEGSQNLKTDPTQDPAVSHKEYNHQAQQLAIEITICILFCSVHCNKDLESA